MGKKHANGAVDLGIVHQAVARESAARQAAEAAASRAGAAVMLLQALLGALVDRLGGTATVTATELEPFAHQQPLLSSSKDDGSIVLTAQPKVPKAVAAKDAPVPVILDLCARCGHEAALIPHVSSDGQRRLVCAPCHASLGQGRPAVLPQSQEPEC